MVILTRAEKKTGKGILNQMEDKMTCGDSVTYTLFMKDWKVYLEIYSDKEIYWYGNTKKPDNFNDIMATPKMEQLLKTLTQNKEKGYCKHTKIQGYDIHVGVGMITAIKTTKTIHDQQVELPQEIYSLKIRGINQLPHQPNFDFECHTNKLVLYEYAPVYKRIQMTFENSVCVTVPGRNKYVYDDEGVTVEYDV